MVLQYIMIHTPTYESRIQNKNLTDSLNEIYDKIQEPKKSYSALHKFVKNKLKLIHLMQKSLKKSPNGPVRMKEFFSSPAITQTIENFCFMEKSLLEKKIASKNVSPVIQDENDNVSFMPQTVKIDNVFEAADDTELNEDYYSKTGSVYHNRGGIKRKSIAIQAHCDDEDLRPNKKFLLERKNDLSSAYVASDTNAPAFLRTHEAVSVHTHKFKITQRVDAESLDYSNVLPSIKTARRWKHQRATSREKLAADMIKNKLPTDVITFHFDSTKRNNLKGDWVTTIVNKNNSEYFYLRPFYLAVESDETLAALFKLQLKR